MPVSMLDSQLADLEPLAADEPGITIDAGKPLDTIVDISARALPR